MLHKIVLSNGQEVAVEMAVIGEREVASAQLTSYFADIVAVLVGLSSDHATALEKSKPDSASIEFDLKLEFQTSRLLAVLCSTSANADLR